MKQREYIEELYKDITMENHPNITLPEFLHETTIESSFSHIKEEPLSCEERNIMDSIIYTPIDNTKYLSIHNNKKPASCHRGNHTSPDIATPTDHTEQCPSSYKKGESVSCEGTNLMDSIFFISIDHTQYPSTHINEKPASCHGENLTSPDIATTSDHTKQCPSSPIKEEPVSCDGGNFSITTDQTQYLPYIKDETNAQEKKCLDDPGIYTQQCPPTHVKEEPLPCVGEQISDVYSVPDNTVKLENNPNSKINEIEVIYQHPAQSTFGDISNLTKYQRAHSRKKTPQCPECGEYFLRKAQLVTHQRLHMGQNPLQCPECRRTFSSTSQLINHQKYHRGKKSFRCFQCFQFWPDRAQLVLHQKSHTEEKPSTCLDCGKNFPSDSHLVVHQRTHTGGRPFRCSECGTHVTVREHLIYLRSRPGEKLNECLQCEKHSKHKISLSNHELHNPVKYTTSHEHVP